MNGLRPQESPPAGVCGEVLRRKLMSSSTGVKSREEDQLWQLIDKARSGDKQAARDLVNLPAIFKMTGAMAAKLRWGSVNGDYRDNDDLHQEILLKLWSKITDFKGESKAEFWIWLKWQARSKQSIDWVRVAKERAVFDKNGLEDRDCPVTKDPYHQVLLSQLLNKLKPLDREIVEGHVSGLGIEQIAEKTDVPKTTVHRRLKKAQKKLVNIVKGGKS
jgi:RNA polymerase sigma factor (sigma-70 family)